MSDVYSVPDGPYDAELVAGEIQTPKNMKGREYILYTVPSMIATSNCHHPPVSVLFVRRHPKTTVILGGGQQDQIGRLLRSTLNNLR